MSDDNRSTRRGASDGKLGVGAEAVEGVHAAQQSNRDPQDQSSLEGRTSASDPANPGSEPLEGRGTEHVPSYGGKGGAPRTSSDTREEGSKDPGTPK